MNGLNPILERRMVGLAATFGVIGMAVAGAALMGWALDIPALKSVIPGLATMKFNTALALLLCGAALWLKTGMAQGALRDSGAEALAILGAIVGLLTLVEYAFNVDLKIDQLFVGDPATSPITGHPGRPSQATAMCILLTGSGIALLDLATRVGQVLVIISAAISSVAIISYVYGIDALYRVPAYSTMAVHTATVLCLLSLGHLLSRPRRCVHPLLISSDAGGITARRLIPAIVLVPLILGWLRVRGQRAGLYETEFGTALAVVAGIAVLIFFVWWQATLLDRSDARRQRLESDRTDLLAREREARLRAEKASQAKDEFLSVVSHELRTPLTPVLLATAMMERRADLPADVRDDIQIIREQIQIESRLIDDLLDMMSFGHGKLALHPEQIDGNEIVRKTLGVFADQFESKGVQLGSELSALSATIMGDAGRLRQVISNLLGNALKFTPQGGSVRVRTYDGPAGHFNFEITDSGVGIQEAALQRIFSPFEQADASTTRQFGGLGIGLTISKVLVELHHGTIQAQSPGLGKGATFLVSLPTCPVPAAAPPPAEVPSAGGNKHKLRILVVEDNVDSLRMLERLLRALGYEIVSAQTASEALNAVAQSKFDLLISDIGLPDVSGWELMRMVRRERQQAIRGIALSGFVADSDRRRSLDAGYLCHIAKPIELNQLVQAIEGAMAASPAPLAN